MAGGAESSAAVETDVTHNDGVGGRDRSLRNGKGRLGCWTDSDVPHDATARHSAGNGRDWMKAVCGATGDNMLAGNKCGVTTMMMVVRVRQTSLLEWCGARVSKQGKKKVGEVGDRGLDKRGWRKAR